MNPLYLSRAVLISYDGEGGAVSGEGSAGAAAGAGTGAGAAAGAGAGAGAGASDARFTQDDLNKYLAEDKRKHQAQLQRVEKTLEETAASKNLTVQEREQLAQQLEDLRKETRTKEQQLSHEKKQVESNIRSNWPTSGRAVRTGRSGTAKARSSGP